jgi:hypothetical protein
MTPDPMWCQIERCKSLGQIVLPLSTGAIRVCLYHYVVLMFSAVKEKEISSS